MFERFRHFVNSHKLMTPRNRILVAVSGGIDSVVLCHLFSRTRVHFALAHCNFNLRGAESDGDELFVKNLAQELDVPFFVKHFDTLEVVDREGISVQMAARDIRYEWFRQLAHEEGYDKIAIAHNLNDQMETFFINLFRGTGISGLRAMLPETDGIIRPLLSFSRDDIEEYAKENGLAHREDSSNASDKYLRNRIRHHLIPLLKELQPSFNPIFHENLSRITDVETIYHKQIERQRDLLVKKYDNCDLIHIHELMNLEAHNTYLYEFLKPYGFNESTSGQITSVLNDIPGKVFYSPTHRLIKDRDVLIIEPLSNVPSTIPEEIFLDPDVVNLTTPISLTFTKIERKELPIIDPSSHIAWLDQKLLKFPLCLRRYKIGDRFRPLGMTGTRKLSDFLTNLKLSIPDKEKVWVLTSNDEIVWVVGYRIDDRFKVTPQTQEILKILRY
ncbi:MAG: tRNA lysidine(34) synthetase TilS [Bacteroidetes bacterium]|nr:tRNA lysidine(34) synthetase TilS [Bacteroidota bacterium]